MAAENSGNVDMRPHRSGQFICRPDGTRGNGFLFDCYKDFAPTELKNSGSILSLNRTRPLMHEMDAVIGNDVSFLLSAADMAI